MDLLKDKIEIENFALTLSGLSFTRKSADSKTVPKNWKLKYPNKAYTQESWSG